MPLSQYTRASVSLNLSHVGKGVFFTGARFLDHKSLENLTFAFS